MKKKLIEYNLIDNQIENYSWYVDCGLVIEMQFKEKYCFFPCRKMSQRSAKKKIKERFVNIDEPDNDLLLAFDNYNEIDQHDLSGNSSTFAHYEHYYCNKSLDGLTMKSPVRCNRKNSTFSDKTDDDNEDSLQQRKKHERERIYAIIESRKAWPVGITTRAATRMMLKVRSNQKSASLSAKFDDIQDTIDCSNTQTNSRKERKSINTLANRNNENELTSNKIDIKLFKNSSTLINESKIIGLIKLKLMRILVFGSIANQKKNFLCTCRNNYIIKSKSRIKPRNDLLSIYNINFACGITNVSLELCFLQWPDSYITKSEFYLKTFGKYFKMTNLALGYYDPEDLESIEHMQSWLKAFYQFHGKNRSVNSVVIRIDKCCSSSFTSRIFFNLKKHHRNTPDTFDHVISSLLNEYRISMSHITLKYRFYRRPSLEPLWKIIYHILINCDDNRTVIYSSKMASKVDWFKRLANDRSEYDHQLDTLNVEKSSLLIDHVKKMEHRLQSIYRKQNVSNWKKFIRNITRTIIRFCKDLQTTRTTSSTT